MKQKLFAKIIKTLIVSIVIFGSFFASNFASAYVVNLSAGLIAHYGMNDYAATTTVVDSAEGNNGIATFNTSVKSVTGVSASTTPVSSHGALSFNGTSDSISMGNVSDITTNDFSISFWARYTNSWTYPTAGIFLSKNDSNSGYTIYSGNAQGRMRFDIFDSAWGNYKEVITTASYNDGAWHHYTFERKNGDTLNIYVDGSLATVTNGGTGTVGSITNTAPFMLGNDSVGSGYFAGSMDDVRVYNRAINTDEITALYNSAHGTEARGVGDLTGGLLGHFKLNDNSGDTNVVNSNGDDNGTATFNTSDNSVAGVSASTTPVSGHGALSLNGSSDFINVGNSFGSFDDGFTPFSLSAWVKLNSPAVDSYNVIMSKQGNVWCAAPGYSFGIQNGKILGWIWHHACNGQTIQVSSTNSVVSNATWAYVTMTYSGSGTASGLKFYVNDQLVPMDVTTDGLAGLDIASTYPFQIGNMGDTDWQFPFKGTIDDARVYNRVLNADEIYTLYNSAHGTEAGDMPGGEIAHWKMNDNLSNTTVIDSIGSLIGTASQRITSAMHSIGIMDGAFTFSNNEFVSAAAPSLPGDFTINTWIKTSSLSFPFLSFSGGYYASGSFDLGWWPSDNRLGITGYFGGCDYPTNRIPLDMTGVNYADNNWHMVTAILDTNTKKLKGMVDNGTTFSGEVDVPGSGVLCTPTGTQIGARSDASWYYGGSIDDTRIYNRVLTSDEISALWNGGAGTEADRAGHAAPPIVTTKYWVGNGNWSDANNWSASSGGPGGTPAPIAGDTVIFDGGGNGDCSVDTDVNVDNIQINDGHWGSIYQGYYNSITTAGDITQGWSTGTFYGGYSGSINVGGNFNINNGSFYNTSVSANGYVNINTNGYDINLSTLYAGQNAYLYTNYGSVYVQNWNANNWGNSVYAGGYVSITNYYGDINLSTLYAGQGSSIYTNYGSINIQNWSGNGGYNQIYAGGWINLSAYGDISLYSLYSGQGAYLNTYYGNMSIQNWTSYSPYNQINAGGWVNISSSGDINLYNLNTGSDATLSASGTVTNNSYWSVNGTIYIPGSFGGYGGIGSGNIEFVGTGDSYIYGSTYFPGSFTCSQPGKHLYFTPGNTQTIAGNFHIAGDGSAYVYLMSQSQGGQWQIDPQGTRSIDYAWVQDSNNVNSTAIDQTNSFDGGDNTNWSFAPPLPSCVTENDNPHYTICTYSKSGTFTVPDGVTKATVYAWGGGGAGGTAGGWSYGSAGGAGGAANGRVILNPGDTDTVVVGGGGVVNSVNGAVGGGGAASINNNDNRFSGGGGGLSGLFTTTPISQDNALIIAGGGGGGSSSRAGEGDVGGAGGGAVGQAGASPYDGKSSYAGNPGTQSGAGADSNTDCVVGSGGQGAMQGGVPRCHSYGGGGGGGYWGGSAGGYSESNTMGGGGGGSGYYNPAYVSSATLTAGSSTTPGDFSNSFRGTAGNAGAVAINGSSGSVVIKYLTPPVDLGAGLITHYKMNDNAANATVVDSKVNHNGTANFSTNANSVAGVSASTTPVAGHGALSFNGSNSCIVSTNGYKGPQSVPFSASLWFKSNSVGNYPYMISSGQTNGYDVFAIMFHDYWPGHIFVNIGNVNYLVSNSRWDDGNWHNVTLTVDASNLGTMYVDGMPDGSTTFSPIFTNAGNDLTIGCQNWTGTPSQSFNGYIDDVRIYNKALSSDVVKNLYNNGLGTESEGVVLAPPAVTVGKTGTQISTTTVPITGQNLGGAFTLLSQGNATTTSIKIKQVGSLATSSFANVKLYYKSEVACSATKPSDATLFGTTTSFDINGIATTTGTITLSDGDQRCLYVVYDLTGTYGTSTLGRSVDFEITNPSADVVLASGTVNPTSALNISGQTIVLDPNSVSGGGGGGNNATSTCSNVVSSMLSLRVSNKAKDPTVFYLQNCAVWKMEGGGTPVRMTNPNLLVRSLSFTNLTGANSSGAVKINMSISNVDSSAGPSYLNVVKTYTTTATVKAWSGNN